MEKVLLGSCVVSSSDVMKKVLDRFWQVLRQLDSQIADARASNRDGENHIGRRRGKRCEYSRLGSRDGEAGHSWLDEGGREKKETGGRGCSDGGVGEEAMKSSPERWIVGGKGRLGEKEDSGGR